MSKRCTGCFVRSGAYLRGLVNLLYLLTGQIQKNNSLVKEMSLVVVQQILIDFSSQLC